ARRARKRWRARRGRCGAAVRRWRRSDPRRVGVVGSRPDRRAVAVTVDRLAVLTHELRSPVAALEALADQAAAGNLPRAVLGRVTELAGAAVHDIARLLCDPELLSLRP